MLFRATCEQLLLLFLIKIFDLLALKLWSAWSLLKIRRFRGWRPSSVEQNLNPSNLWLCSVWLRCSWLPLQKVEYRSCIGLKTQIVLSLASPAWLLWVSHVITSVTSFRRRKKFIFFFQNKAKILCKFKYITYSFTCRHIV